MPIRRFGSGAERPIEGAGRLVVGGEAVAQLGVVAGLGVEERPAAGGIATLDCRQEQSLDSLGIDRHARASGKEYFLT